MGRIERNQMSKVKFGDLTTEQRAAMTDEEWLAVPSEEKKSCHDCRYLKSVLSWWCTNEDAKKARGTSLPGGCLCDFWEPEVQEAQSVETKRPKKSFITKIIEMLFT